MGWTGRWLFGLIIPLSILAASPGVRAEMVCSTADFEDGALGGWIEDNNNESSTGAALGQLVGTYGGTGYWMSAVWYKSSFDPEDILYLSGDLTFQGDIQVSGLVSNPELGPLSHIGLNMFTKEGDQYALQVVHDDSSFAMSGESQWVVALSDFNLAYDWAEWIAVPDGADWLTFKAARIAGTITFSVSFDGGAYEEIAVWDEGRPLLLSAMYGYLTANAGWASPPAGQTVVMDNLIVCSDIAVTGTEGEDEGEDEGEGEAGPCGRLFGSFSDFDDGTSGDWSVINVVSDAEMTVSGGKLMGQISPSSGFTDWARFSQNNVDGNFTLQGSIGLADFGAGAGAGSWSNMGINAYTAGGDERNHGLAVYREGPAEVLNLTGLDSGSWVAVAWDYAGLIEGFIAIPSDAEDVTLRMEREDGLLTYSADFQDGFGFREVATETVPGEVRLEGMLGLGNGAEGALDFASVGGLYVAMDDFLVQGSTVCDFGNSHPGVPVSGPLGFGVLTCVIAAFGGSTLFRRRR